LVQTQHPRHRRIVRASDRVIFFAMAFSTSCSFIIRSISEAEYCRQAEELKREFGKDLAFWGGGYETQSVLPYGTPGEVRRHVKEHVKAMQPGGWFVFQQVHNILANVPPENIVAMSEVVRN